MVHRQTTAVCFIKISYTPFNLLASGLQKVPAEIFARVQWCGTYFGETAVYFNRSGKLQEF